MTCLEIRVKRLERSNKFMRYFLISSAMIITSSFLLGAAVPSPSVLRAKRFVLLDDAGAERAELSSNTTSTALQLLNRDGSHALVLAAGSEANAFIVSDLKGKVRGSFTASNDETAQIGLWREGENDMRVLIKDSPDASAIYFRDKKLELRTGMGIGNDNGSMFVFDRSGKTRVGVTPEGVTTFEEDGSLQWGGWPIHDRVTLKRVPHSCAHFAHEWVFAQGAKSSHSMWANDTYTKAPALSRTWLHHVRGTHLNIGRPLGLPFQEQM